MYNLIPKYNRVEDDLWSTKTILNFMVFTGARYIQPLLKTKGNNKNEVGVFPEFRFYFNPYLPRSIKYIDDNDMEIIVRGDYSLQFSFGFGFGIYIMEVGGSAYLALKFEYSTIDGFETLKKLNYDKHFDFPENRQISIGLSLFVW